MPFPSKGRCAMSGRFFLDTNAIIELLKGNAEILKIIETADFIACSVISDLEYRSFPGLLETDARLIYEFLSRISVLDITHDDIELREKIAVIRRSKKIKLPDAIILASAKLNNCQLVTADKELMKFSDHTDVIGFSTDKS